LCVAGLSCLLNGIIELTNKTYNGVCTKPLTDPGPCRLGLPDPCPPKFYCKSTLINTIDGTCEPLPGDDKPCATDSIFKPDCAPLTRCIESTGQCAALGRNKTYCESNDACYSGYCAGNECRAPNFCSI
jgi:hypothetical protein